MFVSIPIIQDKTMEIEWKQWSMNNRNKLNAREARPRAQSFTTVECLFRTRRARVARAINCHCLVFIHTIHAYIHYVTCHAVPCCAVPCRAVLCRNVTWRDMISCATRAWRAQRLARAGAAEHNQQIYVV